MMWLQEKTKVLVGRLTVEPCLFVYCIGLAVFYIGIDSVILQKFCSPEKVPKNFSQSCQPRLVSHDADVSTAQMMIVELLNGLVVLGGGLWRDSTGLSGPLIYFSIGGTILACSIFLVAAIFWQISPWVTGILTALVIGISGGKQLVMFAASCFIGVNTKKEERTIRLTLMLSSAVGGGLLGSFISGYIISYFGYVYFFSITICIYACAVMLGVIFISERKIKSEGESKQLNLSALLVMFKPRKNRSVIWILVINVWMIYSVLSASNILTFYYVKAAYNMSVTELGILTSLMTTMHFFGTMVVVPLLIKFFKWSDFTLAKVAVFICGASALCNAFNTDKIIYIAVCSSNLFTMSLLTFHRSIITKSVNSKELGVVLSAFAIGEGILPIAFLPLYDLIFKATVHNFPGAFYGINAAVCFTAVINLFIAKRLYKENCDEPTDEQL